MPITRRQLHDDYTNDNISMNKLIDDMFSHTNIIISIILV